MPPILNVIFNLICMIVFHVWFEECDLKCVFLSPILVIEMTKYINVIGNETKEKNLFKVFIHLSVFSLLVTIIIFNWITQNSRELMF